MNQLNWPAGSTARATLRSMPLAARRILDVLARISEGTLSVRLPDGNSVHLGTGAPHASIEIDDWRVFGAVLRSGDIGFAQGYVDGRWRTDSLITLLDLLVRNRATIEEAVYGSAAGSMLHRLRHLLNFNSLARARRNVRAHYDLGNEFFALWLDETMTYSSALFEGDGERSLADAQQAKYGRILGQLGDCGPRLLEIGCGWGGFASRAAERGHHVTALTLSPRQRRYAVDRMEREGHAGRCEIRIEDYREHRGVHDGIVSIEMLEAVGERYWPHYFRMLARSLAARGRAVIQTITIDDALFPRYRRGTDFIQQHVFPGGMLPSPSRLTGEIERAGLRVDDRFAFGADYARTLALWRQRFEAVLGQVRQMGFDDTFIRSWQFYLVYCEAAFRHRSIDVVQWTVAHRHV